MSGAEEGAEPSRRHPHLVQLLRVGAETRAGVVREHARALLAQAGAEHRRGVSVLGRFRHVRMEVQVERLEDLRPALAVVGPGSAQRLLDPAERPLVAVEQLDLELVEAAGDALMVEHRDRVVDDLGAVGADALPACAQAGDRLQPRPSQVSCEQRQQIGGQRRRRAGLLQLEPGAPDRSFSCQRPLPFSTR